MYFGGTVRHEVPVMRNDDFVESCDAGTICRSGRCQHRRIAAGHNRYGVLACELLFQLEGSKYARQLVLTSSGCFDPNFAGDRRGSMVVALKHLAPMQGTQGCVVEHSGA